MNALQHEKTFLSSFACFLTLNAQVFLNFLAYFVLFCTDGIHLSSSPPCWCTERKRKKSFGNLTLLLCKTWAIICYCFVHQHGRLITWLNTIYKLGQILFGLMISFLVLFKNEISKMVENYWATSLRHKAITSLHSLIAKLLIDQILRNKDCHTSWRSYNRRFRSDWTSWLYGEQNIVKICNNEKIFTEVRKWKSKQ